MDVNNYLYNSSSLSSVMSSASYRGVQWRGGVTGWEPKEASSSGGSSSSGVSSEAAGYLTSVKDYGGKLRDAMQSLAGSGKTSSIFDSLGAASSNTSALTVSISDQAQAKEFLQAGSKKEVDIYQVAEAQQNKGAYLNAASTKSVQTGRNSFSIEKDGQSFSFDVDVNYSDSNRTVQQKVADAINEENMGVKATVQYNETTKKSSLVLTSAETGEENGFTVQDDRGNAVSELGIGSATRLAQDAIYSVDGVDEQSASNTVDLGDGMKATLIEETEKAVTVEAGENQTGITNGIYDFVNNFNKLRETAVNMNGDRSAKNLQSRLDGLVSAYSNVLEKVGITTNSSGYLQIDKEVMNESILSGEAEKALGKDSSFTRSMTSLAAQAEEDPSRFLSYKARTESESSDAAENMDFDSLAYNFTAHQSSQMMQWDMVGMLFSAGF